MSAGIERLVEGSRGTYGLSLRGTVWLQLLRVPVPYDRDVMCAYRYLHTNSAYRYIGYMQCAERVRQHIEQAERCGGDQRLLRHDRHVLVVSWGGPDDICTNDSEALVSQTTVRRAANIQRLIKWL